MSFEISFKMTWRSLLLHCIIFEIGEGNELTNQKLMMSFVWLISFLSNQKIMLSSSREEKIFENL